MNSRYNIFKLITSNHDKLYVFGLSLLAFSMPLSPFAVSVSQFILLGNWLIERNFRQKFQRIKTQKALLVFLSVYLVHIVGMFYSSDWDYGLHDLKIKLPLLGIPIIIASSEKLSKEKINIILIGFIAGVFGGTLISFGAYLGLFGFEYIHISEISIFISHIRFSLFIILSISILLFQLPHLKPNYQKLIAFILIVWFHFFLFVLEAFTGLVLMFFVDIIFLFYILSNQLSKRLALLVGTISMLTISVLAIYHIYDIIQILKVKDSLPPKEERYTKYGNPYTFKLEEHVTENGYHIYWYISREELDTAWQNRSSAGLMEKDDKDQIIYYTLLRYLSSKGLPKDAAGVQQLTKADINNIENGIANYLYTKFGPLKRRTFQIFWEIDNYLKGGNPTNHSVTQRFEFFKAGYTIFKQNFWFGVGTGDVKNAYRKYYKTSDSQLSKEKQLRTHNQYLTFYLTFGIFLASWIIAALLMPLILESKKINMVTAVFFLIVFLSMLAEDTLETQAGVTFFSYFYALFLFGGREYQNDLVE